LLAEAEAEKGDAQKIGNDDDQVDRMNAHQAPASQSCERSQRSQSRIVSEAKSVKEPNAAMT
jgi:hypothetical protein